MSQSQIPEGSNERAADIVVNPAYLPRDEARETDRTLYSPKPPQPDPSPHRSSGFAKSTDEHTRTIKAPNTGNLTTASKMTDSISSIT